MAIWNGLTQEGAVVPIQVDAQGRVVVSGGGGAPSQVYGTAKASGEVYADGSVNWTYNAAVSKEGVGVYRITFNTPLPNPSYIGVATPLDFGTTFLNVSDRTATSFLIYAFNAGGSWMDATFGFAVFNADPDNVTPLILPNSALQDIQRLKDAVGLADS